MALSIRPSMKSDQKLQKHIACKCRHDEILSLFAFANFSATMTAKTLAASPMGVSMRKVMSKILSATFHSSGMHPSRKLLTVLSGKHV